MKFSGKELGKKELQLDRKYELLKMETLGKILGTQ